MKRLLLYFGTVLALAILIFAGLKEQIKDQEIHVMDKNDFIAAIEELLN